MFGSAWLRLVMVVGCNLHLFAPAVAILVVYRQTRKKPVVLAHELGPFGVRNLSWSIGLLKALVYALQSPPELDEAERWRAKRDAQLTESTTEATEKNMTTKEIDRANG